MRKKSLKTVLALCFTQVSETYHHWRVFAHGSSGVCIQFNRAKLMKGVTRQPGVRAKFCISTLKDIKKKNLRVEDLPFLKRYPYEDEYEFRVIYEVKTSKKKSLDIAIPLSSIDRITLSPWIPLALRDHVESTICGIPGCKSLEIFRSTLISNEQWKNLSDDAI